jgi:hypothetical protein
MIDIKGALLCRDGDHEAESFLEMRRRRIADVEC